MLSRLGEETFYASPGQTLVVDLRQLDYNRRRVPQPVGLDDATASSAGVSIYLKTHCKRQEIS